MMEKPHWNLISTITNNDSRSDPHHQPLYSRHQHLQKANYCNWLRKTIHIYLNSINGNPIKSRSRKPHLPPSSHSLNSSSVAGRKTDWSFTLYFVQIFFPSGRKKVKYYISSFLLVYVFTFLLCLHIFIVLNLIT